MNRRNSEQGTTPGWNKQGNTQNAQIVISYRKKNMACFPDVMRNQELEKVLEVNTKIEIN